MLFAPIVSGRSPALKTLADLSSFRGPGALPLTARKTAVQGRKIAPRASAGATVFLGAKQTRAVRFSTSAFDPTETLANLLRP
jgi:hypothetical protein